MIVVILLVILLVMCLIGIHYDCGEQVKYYDYNNFGSKYRYKSKDKYDIGGF